MRTAWRMIAAASVLSIGGLLFGCATARAGDDGYGGGGYGGGYGGGGYGGGGYGGGYGGGGYGGGGYGGGYSYYGNGGHDLQPHGHTRQTPFGTFQYFGNGRHDLRPHVNSVTPYGIESYNGRRTQSYSPPTPYGYRPW